MSDRFPPLFAALPEALDGDWQPETPWELLGAPLESLLGALPSSDLAIPFPADAHLVGDRIVVGRGTRIAPGAVLEGPLWIGEDVEIRPGAYLRGGCWIGDGAIVGTHSELKRAILLPGARAPHQNYVGDSILGAGVNLGAGTILSNFRHDGGEILVRDLAGRRRATGLRKFGAVLGDEVSTGCNCVLHPGCVVGRATRLYPGVQLRAGAYAAGLVVKLRQELLLEPQTEPAG